MVRKRVCQERYVSDREVESLSSGGRDDVRCIACQEQRAVSHGGGYEAPHRRAAIGSAIRHLAEDPSLQEQLRRQPDLIPSACDEPLRLYTPNQGFARPATRTTKMRGQQIEAGEQVALVLTSANRDPDIFPEPDRFVLGRTPNPHIAFGQGSHKCAGKHVAELEMGLTLDELLAATDHFSLAGEVPPVYWPLYGPEVLPLRCEPRAQRSSTIELTAGGRRSRG